MISSPTTFGAITIPLSFAGLAQLNVDTTVVTATEIGITWGPAGSHAGWTFKSSLVDNVNKTILIGLVSFSQVSLPSTDTLVYIHFDLDASGQGETIPVDSTFVPPTNSLTLTTESAFEFVPQWRPGTIEVGFGLLAGDVYPDGIINSTDIVFLVNYILRGGPAPDPVWLGDVNHDCDVTVADVIYLVDYIFRSGPRPLLGCT
jgi:hypothetical protein